MRKEISKSRRYFRRSLFVLAGVSAIFFATMITLRANKSAHWYVVRNYQTEIFEIDVFKHQIQASLNDAEDKHEIAASLIQKSIFSPIYLKAGLEMMRQNAESGYPPSQFTYGELLEKTAFTRDPVTFRRIPDPEKQMKARYYYNLAAAEDYAPAIAKLKTPTSE